MGSDLLQQKTYPRPMVVAVTSVTSRWQKKIMAYTLENEKYMYNIFIRYVEMTRSYLSTEMKTWLYDY